MASTTTQTLASANSLLAYHASLVDGLRASQRDHRRQIQHYLPSSECKSILDIPIIPPSEPSPPPSPILESVPASRPPARQNLPPAKLARSLRYKNYVAEEETIRNDYSQRYVDGGDWPQNWVIGAEPEHRFEEYPKQHRLLSLKKQSVQDNSLPPTYLPFSSLSSIHPSKFDVILIDPPFSSSFTWNHLQDLPIPSLAADPSFVFLWVGSGAGDGLERGREVLAKWGYRRCEDVVWVKTNRTSNKGPGTDAPSTSLLTRTKQHCLIGIRGTVRRSTDSWFVHCNVDTDVIIWEGDHADPTRKPPEMYTLIENFCLGTRRLEVFGKLASSLRRGWVTAVGGEIPEGSLPIHVEGEQGGQAILFNRETWDRNIKDLAGGAKCVVPMTPDIDALRPKSPVRGQSQNNNNNGGSSGGVPLSATSHGQNGMIQNMAPRFANNGVRNFGGMEMNPMMGMDGVWPGIMGGGWNPFFAQPQHGEMDPQAMMNMAGMNPHMMDPQALAMMAGQAGGQIGGQQMAMLASQTGGQNFVPMLNGMNWGDGGGQFVNNPMMPGMGGGQWTGY